ncbi:ribonuclease P protein subunit p30-like [Vairimorpha necatrix]|uniref:Ribonuclease P protein subunit p30-like n=1 Tax=Vairimorpha necatrix TaxID=6039 RepID=A0AAX4J965_9MICR
MFYDMSISSKYNKNDLVFLEDSDYSGFCFTYSISQNDISKFTRPSPPSLPSKKSFIKLSVNLLTHSYNTKSLFSKCDVLCLTVPDFETPVDENMCDVILLDMTKPLKFRNINPNIFYEVDILSALYDKRDRMMWLYNFRELIRVTKCRNIIVGSAATRSTEVKSPLDIMKMLLVVDIGEDKARQILRNNEKCLEKCAERRFMKNECVFDDIPEGALKEEFLINKFKQN